MFINANNELNIHNNKFHTDVGKLETSSVVDDKFVMDLVISTIPAQVSSNVGLISSTGSKKAPPTS